MLPDWPYCWPMPLAVLAARFRVMETGAFLTAPMLVNAEGKLPKLAPGDYQMQLNKNAAYYLSGQVL